MFFSRVNIKLFLKNHTWHSSSSDWLLTTFSLLFGKATLPPPFTGILISLRSKKYFGAGKKRRLFQICCCRQALGVSMALRMRSLRNRYWWSDPRLSTRRQTLGNIFAPSDFQPKPTYFTIVPTTEKGCDLLMRS